MNNFGQGMKRREHTEIHSKGTSLNCNLLSEKRVCQITSGKTVHAVLRSGSGFRNISKISIKEGESFDVWLFLGAPISIRRNLSGCVSQDCGRQCQTAKYKREGAEIIDNHCTCTLEFSSRYRNFNCMQIGPDNGQLLVSTIEGSIKICRYSLCLMDYKGPPDLGIVNYTLYASSWTTGRAGVNRLAYHPRVVTFTTNQPWDKPMDIEVFALDDSKALGDAELTLWGLVTGATDEDWLDEDPKELGNITIIDDEICDGLVYCGPPKYRPPHSPLQKFWTKEIIGAVSVIATIFCGLCAYEFYKCLTKQRVEEEIEELQARFG